MSRTLYHRIYGRKRRNLALGGRRLKPCPQNHGIEYRVIYRTGKSVCRACKALRDRRYAVKVQAHKRGASREWMRKKRGSVMERCSGARDMNRFYRAWQAVLGLDFVAGM